ncbi:AraC family transcriptional regulator [Desulfosporosinus sp. FKA]|uniref:AraC family transcriptional regulator n=1 Tax=Desulfosporosinus sp. FKA TaxID=1969834 RepID=UPI000B4A4648|nr:AraC family transcriptional regulator [Desulfosporosinus sp. FKA]
MEWLKNLSNAIDYIEDNLVGEISYEEAAKIACCSTYYFQRMFSYVAGISLSEYIRRRRMTQAAFELQATEIKVLDVALKYGYTSPTSFNRAFQCVHGISPASAKSQGSVLNAYPPIKFSVKVTGGNVMSYRVEEKEAMRIVGIRIPLSFDMEENIKLVPPFWSKTIKSSQFSEICDLSNQFPKGVLGVTVCQSTDEIYYFIAAATDKPTPDGMFEYTIPAATWVIFESDGHFKESIQNIFRRFLTEWLPFSGYTYAELPDIEVYPIRKERPQEGHSEVWIAVKKEKKN